MRSQGLAAMMALGTIMVGTAIGDDAPVPLEKGVRGLVVKAPTKVAVDGKLREWSSAFCTPVHYGHNNLLNRGSQIFYLWDEEAFYLGLRCLDQKPANPGNAGSLWNGDSVEFYFDARTGDGLRTKDWSSGAVHVYFTPFEGAKVQPRWSVRQGIATSGVQLKGVEIAASSEDGVTELEFKLPWANFPDFQAKLGAVIGVDAELCSGDGGNRTDRTFSYGSPLSVQQPASLGKVELVGAFSPEYLPAVGPSTFPMWVDTPWTQPERARVRAVVAIPPGFLDEVGTVEFRIHDAEGRVVRTQNAEIASFGPKPVGFARAIATWSNDDFAPNAHFATAKVLSKAGKTLATVTPRMVSEANMTGR